MTWRFTFLQHGVLVSDLSTWLNGKEIDRFITSSPAEYDAVVRDGSPYRFTTKEVELTGLPRHDALLARADRHAEPDLILVAPTWRSALVSSETRRGNERTAADGFYGSVYAQRWRTFLHSGPLRDLAQDHGRQIAFMPHVNVLPYLDWFALPDHVRVLAVTSCDIQGALSRCAVAITDYSSLVFDAAYLRRQVIYYQFDRRAFYGGDHLWRPGHFSFEEDGFGPVVEEEAELHRELAMALQREHPPSPYADRMERSLPYQDGRACERVVASIDRLGRRPRRPR
jgi:CDP-glycerol glycerophosphotransferase (TagB/SpsB family)